LDVPVECVCGVKYGIGGVLPNANHAVIGTGDFGYQAGLMTKFCTEMKTRVTYPLREQWYRRSRACQSIGALYYSGAPLLLCSPSAFKLLFEPDARDNIFLFPEGHYSGDPSDPDFPFVVGLLLLSTRNFCDSADRSKVLNTPVKRKLKVSARTTIEKRKRSGSRRSNRIAGAKRPSINYGSHASDEYSTDDTSEGSRIFFLSPDEIEEAFQSIENSRPIQIVTNEFDKPGDLEDSHEQEEGTSK
jgi:hypothetical protein